MGNAPLVAPSSHNNYNSQDEYMGGYMCMYAYICYVYKCIYLCMYYICTSHQPHLGSSSYVNYDCDRFPHRFPQSPVKFTLLVIP